MLKLQLLLVLHLLKSLPLFKMHLLLLLLLLQLLLLLKEAVLSTHGIAVILRRQGRNAVAMLRRLRSSYLRNQ